MAATRRLQPSPIPPAELAQLKETLPTTYGSHLWDPEGQRILVVRVPRDEPDLVNDLEQAVEHLAPADLSNTPSCLLVGNTKSHLVTTHLLHDLMVARLDFDARQCAGLRSGIPAGQYRIYKAPEDPHKLTRMLVRAGRPTVADVTEEDLEAILVEVGPRAQQTPYKDVQIVYLVADKDHLRLPGKVFVGDLETRWNEQAERRRLAAEVEAKEKAQRLAEEHERQAALADAQAAAARAATEAAARAAPAAAQVGPKIPSPSRLSVTAPLRSVDRHEGARTWAAEDATAADLAAAASHPPAVGATAATRLRPTPWTGAGAAAGGMSVAERAAMYAHLDGLDAAGRRGAAPRGFGGAGAPSAPAELADVFPQGALWPRRIASPAPPAVAAAAVGAPDVPAGGVRPVTTAPAAPSPTSALVSAVRDRLTALRFEVLLKPPVPGIDMAAERAEGYPQRVIVFTPERLDDAAASHVLAKARDLDADMALVVCAQADADAKRRFIATKARHVDPVELTTLEL